MTRKKGAKTRLAEVLKEEALGERALRTILGREGYAQADIDAAVATVDWAEQGERAYQEEDKTHDMPEVAMVMLRARGFTAEEAEHIVKSHGDPVAEHIRSIWADAGQQPPEEQLRYLRAMFPGSKAVPDLKDISKAAAGDQRAQARITADMLLSMGTSKQHLQLALNKTQIPADIAHQTIREARPNWKQQARIAAERTALETTDSETIKETLRAGGFTPVQVAYAMSTAHLTDEQAAIALAKDYISTIGDSPEGLRDELNALGYDPAYRDAAMAAVADTDWLAAGSKAIRAQLDNPTLPAWGPERFRASMLEEGYTDEQIDAAFEGFDWPVRAVHDYFLWPNGDGTGPVTVDSMRKVQRIITEIGYSDELAEKGVTQYAAEAGDRKMIISRARAAAEYAGSPAALREMLEDGEFTPEEVDDIMQHVFIDEQMAARQIWAAEMRDLIQDGLPATPTDLKSLLQDSGFSEETVRAVLEDPSISWTEMAGLYAMSLRADDMDEDEIRGEMIKEEFDPAVIDAAVDHAMEASVETANSAMRVTVLLAALESLHRGAAELDPTDPDERTELMERNSIIERLQAELLDMGVDMDDLAGKF